MSVWVKLWIICVILTLTGLPPCHRVTWLASLGWVERGGNTAVLRRPFTFTKTEILVVTAQETFSLNWLTLSTSYLPFFPVSTNGPLLDDLFYCVLMGQVGLLKRSFTNQSELMRQCVNEFVGHEVSYNVFDGALQDFCLCVILRSLSSQSVPLSLTPQAFLFFFLHRG